MTIQAPTAAPRIEPLTSSTWPALEALFREGGDPRWCWCGYWRMRARDFAAAKVPELRANLRGLAEAADPPPGLVALEGDRAIGWVSVGPRADYERIVRSKVIPTIDDRAVWSIVCFAVSAGARGRGIAAALLEAAVAFAFENGAPEVEAYPVAVEQGLAIDDAAAFSGLLSMFTAAGFEVVAERASDLSAARRRVVVRRSGPSSTRLP
jgi:ribosomal protein S18 acetylase RimI-like enzyme